MYLTRSSSNKHAFGLRLGPRHIYIHIQQNHLPRDANHPSALLHVKPPCGPCCFYLCVCVNPLNAIRVDENERASERASTSTRRNMCALPACLPAYRWTYYLPTSYLLTPSSLPHHYCYDILTSTYMPIGTTWARDGEEDEVPKSVLFHCVGLHCIEAEPLNLLQKPSKQNRRQQRQLS